MVFNIFKKDNEKCTDTKCDEVINEEGYKNVCNTMNDFGVSAKDIESELIVNEILNISKTIMEKDNERIKIQNNIDKIMSCDAFIIEGYKIYNNDESMVKKDKVYLSSFRDELKSFLTKDYYDKMHKLESEMKELKNKLNDGLLKKNE